MKIKNTPSVEHPNPQDRKAMGKEDHTTTRKTPERKAGQPKTHSRRVHPSGRKGKTMQFTQGLAKSIRDKSQYNTRKT